MRVRLRYSKLGKIRFTSHRDVARMWERALRRVGLPVGYTEGFSPRPKIAFGLALSTGHESLAEFLDIDLDVPTNTAIDLDVPGGSAIDLDVPPNSASDLDVPGGSTASGPDVPPNPGLALDVAGLPGLLTPALPVGIDVTAAAAVPPGTPSLQESVTSSTWSIGARGLRPADADRLVAAVLSAEHLVITRIRKGREVTDDLRPAVLSVSVAGPTADGSELVAELAVHPRSVRPAELLVALSPEGAIEEGRVLRTAQTILRDGSRAEPLAAIPRPHAELRAS